MIHVFLWFLGVGQNHTTYLFFMKSEGSGVHCMSWRDSPSCSRYGEMEDPSLEKVALDDIMVFLMTVGDSSLVNTYSNALPARTPNLPSMTKVRVTRGWAARKKKGKNQQTNANYLYVLKKETNDPGGRNKMCYSLLKLTVICIRRMASAPSRLKPMYDHRRGKPRAATQLQVYAMSSTADNMM